MLLPRLRTIPPVALVALQLATACVTQARDVANEAATAPGSQGVEVPDAIVAATVDPRPPSSSQPVAGGRDPPAGPADSGVRAPPVDAGGDWVPNAVVERVVDGDTLIARIGTRSETVRLIGIDTPESVAPTRPVQCFGEEASL